MKQLLYILFAVTLFTACSSDDDNNDIDLPDPEFPEGKAESLAGNKFFSFIRSENLPIENGKYDEYRVFTFTSDNQVVEHTSKDSEDGEVIFKHNGTYKYVHPNLRIIIDQDGFYLDIKATMNDSKSSFSYDVTSEKSYTFKKKE